MALDLQTILIFLVLALLYAALVPPAARAWALLVVSLIAVYILQPPLPIRFTDFILPTAVIVLTAACWWSSRAPDQTITRQDLIALGFMVTAAVGMALFRYVDADLRITPSRPPEPLHVAVALLAAAALIALLRRGWRAGVMLAVLVALFLVLNTDPAAAALSGWWRGQTGQDVSLGAALDWRWLGFSYVAFRLIHTLRDRQNGILPPLSLRDYSLYALFFPAYTAGPIDRAERFQTDTDALPSMRRWDAGRFAQGGERIAMGLFKKFVIADTLALGAALTPANAVQAESALALWVLVYGYALRLFFDFSGYTDIAIGIGILFGIRLPENFDRPYLKTNITTFWQSWHRTLSDWARFYVFSPLSRALLTRKPKPSPALIVFTTQMATMMTIGLWHGVTLPFLVWGLWHGAGLFAHKQWSERTRRWYRAHTPNQRRLWTGFAWVLTFHFVVLGWVWFALPDIGLAAQTFGRLFGLGW